jgi:hypothetical protein
MKQKKKKGLKARSKLDFETAPAGRLMPHTFCRNIYREAVASQSPGLAAYFAANPG